MQELKRNIITTIADIESAPHPSLEQVGKFSSPVIKYIYPLRAMETIGNFPGLC